MSSFKDLNSRLGLFFWNRAGILLVVFVVCAVVAMLLLISIFDRELLNLSFVGDLWAKIVIILVCFIGCASFIVGARYASKDNWRIAIDEAWSFIAKNPECHSKIVELISKVKETKNPSKLNEWINNYEKWQSTREKLKLLEKERDEIPQKIAEKIQIIRTLETKIFA